MSKLGDNNFTIVEELEFSGANKYGQASSMVLVHYIGSNGLVKSLIIPRTEWTPTNKQKLIQANDTQS